MNALSRVGATLVQYALQPLGKSNNLLIKIANLALPLFALGGVVAAAYYAFSGTKIATKLKPMTPIPPLGQAALTFAQDQLRANPSVKCVKFSTPLAQVSTYQPVNKDIAALTTLFWEEETRFNNILEKVPAEGRLSDEHFMNSADRLMKLGYAIGVLTLQELDAFVDQLKTINITRTKAQALAIKDSYQYLTYHFTTISYHFLRSNGNRNPDPAHAALFYTQGTKQNEWNQLYNDFCDRIRMYVTEANLQKANNHLYKWTTKDTNLQTFSPEPNLDQVLR